MREQVPDESRSVNDLILSCFKKCDCYLFPHPGTKVALESTYNGNVTG